MSEETVAEWPPKPPYGPDAKQSEPDKKEAPKTNAKNPPRASGRVFGSLGTNKKLRSPVRKLTRPTVVDGNRADNERTDWDKLVNFYVIIAGASERFHPRFAQAVDLNAERCVDAWFDAAEQNDNVRRGILACIEGGALSKVFFAHLPIGMAIMPASAYEFMFRFMSPPSTNVPDDPSGLYGESGQ